MSWERRALVAIVAVSSLVAAATLLRDGGEPAPCSPRDLRAVAGVQGATGSLMGGLTITNRSDRTCSLPRRPHVRLIWNGRSLGHRQVPWPSAFAHPNGVRPLGRLRSGESARILLRWWNTCGPHPPVYGFSPSVELRLPSTGGEVVAPLDQDSRPVCNRPRVASSQERVVDLWVSGFLTLS